MIRTWVLLIGTGMLGLAGCGESMMTEAFEPNSAARLSSVESNAEKPAAEAPLFPEPEGELSLHQAMGLALRYHPELRVVSYDIRIAEARRLQAGLRPNPDLEIEVEEFGGTAPRNAFDGAESTIRLSQELETRGKRDKRKQVAELDMKLADWDYRSTMLDILAQTRAAFVRAWIAQEQLAVAEDRVRLSQAVFDSIRAMVDSGRQSPADLARAQVVLSEQEMEFRKVREEANLTRTLLSGFWGGGRATFTSVRGDSLRVEPPAEAGSLLSRLSRNPDLQRWATEHQQRRAQLALERAKGTSNFSISGGIKRLEEDDDHAFVVGVSIPLPLSDRNQGGKLEAVHQLARAAEQQRAAELRITQSFHAVYSEWTTSYHQIEQIQSRILPATQQVFDAARMGYEQGKYDYLKLLDAQQSLFETRTNYLESLLAYHLARIEMDRLLGEPAPTEETKP